MHLMPQRAGEKKKKQKTLNMSLDQTLKVQRIKRSAAVTQGLLLKSPFFPSVLLRVTKLAIAL